MLMWAWWLPSVLCGTVAWAIAVPCPFAQACSFGAAAAGAVVASNSAPALTAPARILCICSTSSLTDRLGRGDLPEPRHAKRRPRGAPEPTRSVKLASAGAGALELALLRVVDRRLGVGGVAADMAASRAFIGVAGPYGG